MSSRVGCGLVLAGWLLPVLALLSLLVVPGRGHSEDYGWGLLAVTGMFASLVGSGLLMSFGVFDLARASPKTKAMKAFLILGVFGLCILTAYLVQVVVA